VDEYLRALERRYQSSGAPQDGLALFQGLLRSGAVIILDNFSQSIWKSVEEIGFNFNARNLELYGELLSETLTRILAQARATSPRNRVVDPQATALYGVLCRYADDRPHGSTYLTARPSYRIYLFTLSKSLGACQYCRRGYPHDCDAFVHPASEGEVIEVDPEECNEADPLLREASEKDAPIERTWYASQTAPRRMEVITQYHIHRWIFSSNADTGEVPTTWTMVNNWPAGDFTDSVPAVLADPDYLLKTIKRSMGDYNVSHPGFGPPSRSQEKACLVILNSLEQEIPRESPHEPLEQPPSLITTPCEEFQVIPGGQVISEMVGGRMRIVQDNTTTCGHGYLSEPRFLPLCPPMWSDVEQAGWRCNTCGKLLGMAAGQPGDFIMCKVCQVKTRLERDAERGGPTRVAIQSFRCPCSEKFSSLEEAMECCGEEEQEIDVREKWTWSDYD
jgi:hypothetical protein